MRIALLEDDPAQAAFAIEALTKVGYICRQFLRGVNWSTNCGGRHMTC